MSGYAMWFGLPVVALAAPASAPTWRLTPAARAFVAILLASAAISTTAKPRRSTRPRRPPQLLTTAARNPCFETASYAAKLANLPPGLEATEIDYGPFLLCTSTPHSVIAAPYHRASAGILTTYRPLTATARGGVRAALADLGADLSCVGAPHRAPGLTDAQAEAACTATSHPLRFRIARATAGGPAFAVYRVKP